jgi:hypothetical protein
VENKIGVVLIWLMCYAVDHNVVGWVSQSVLVASGVESGASMISSLNELIRFIDDSETAPASHKRYLRSALNRARVFLASGPRTSCSSRRCCFAGSTSCRQPWRI